MPRELFLRRVRRARRRHRRRCDRGGGGGGGGHGIAHAESADAPPVEDLAKGRSNRSSAAERYAIRATTVPGSLCQLICQSVWDGSVNRV